MGYIGYKNSDKQFFKEGEKFRIVQGIFKSSKVLICTKVTITPEKVLIHHQTHGIKSPIDYKDCHKVDRNLIEPTKKYTWRITTKCNNLRLRNYV